MHRALLALIVIALLCGCGRPPASPAYDGPWPRVRGDFSYDYYLGWNGVRGGFFVGSPDFPARYPTAFFEIVRSPSGHDELRVGAPIEYRSVVEADQAPPVTFVLRDRHGVVDRGAASERKRIIETFRYRRGGQHDPAPTPITMSFGALRVAPGRFTVGVLDGERMLVTPIPIAVGRVPCFGGPATRVYIDRGARIEYGDGRATLTHLRIDRWEATDDTPAYRIEWMHDGVVVRSDERRAERANVAASRCLWTFGEESYVVPQEVLAAPRAWSARIFREGHVGVLVRFDEGDAVSLSQSPWPADLATRLAATPRDRFGEKRDPSMAPQLRAMTRSARVAELVEMPDDWTPDTVYPAAPKDRLVCVKPPRAVHVEPLGPGGGGDVIVTDRECRPGDPVEVWHPPPREDPRKKHEARIRELTDLVAKLGYPWKPEEHPSPEDLP